MLLETAFGMHACARYVAIAHVFMQKNNVNLRFGRVQHENRIRTPAILSMVFVLEGYIFINSEPKIIWEIAEAALKIEGIKMAHAVTGQFDIVAYAEFVNIDMLRRIITELQSLNGVQRTQTAVAIPPRLK